jgi:hypothetical protein
MKQQKRRNTEEKKRKQTSLGRPNKHPGGCGAWSAPTRVLPHTYTRAGAVVATSHIHKGFSFPR